MSRRRRDLELVLPDWLIPITDDDTENREFYITKGLGAGGTYAGALWHLHTCLINSRSKYSWAIAPTFQQVQDTLIPTFGEALQNNFGFVEGSDYDVITSGRPRIELKITGQEIAFKSANRADRFVGPSISHYLMTEPGLCQAVAFEKAGARLRCPRARRLQKFYEGTPEGLGNHWEKIANFPEGKHPERNAVRVRLSTSNNTFLKPSYVANLTETYSYDPAKLESYLHGNFVPFQKGTAYWNFHESRNVESNLRPSPYLPLLFCWDFGRSPLAWVTMQRQAQERNHIRRDRFCALSESSGNSRGMMDAIVEFIVQYPPEVYKDTPIHVYGDASGYALSHKTPGCDYDQIQQYLQGRYNKVSIEAARKAPEIRNRLERVNSLFAHDLFVVSNQCTNLIRGLTLTNLKDGTWKQDKPKDADYTHYPDAVGYPLFQLTKDTDLEKPEAKHKFGTNR